MYFPVRFEKVKGPYNIQIRVWRKVSTGTQGEGVSPTSSHNRMAPKYLVPRTNLPMLDKRAFSKLTEQNVPFSKAGKPILLFTEITTMLGVYFFFFIFDTHLHRKATTAAGRHGETILHG